MPRAEASVGVEAAQDRDGLVGAEGLESEHPTAIPGPKPGGRPPAKAAVFVVKDRRPLHATDATRGPQ